MSLPITARRKPSFHNASKLCDNIDGMLLRKDDTARGEYRLSVIDGIVVEVYAVGLLKPYVNNSWSR